MSKRYRLLKDLPDCRAAAIYHLTYNGEDYVCYENMGDVLNRKWSVVYNKEYVENNPEWFELIPDTPEQTSYKSDLTGDAIVTYTIPKNESGIKSVFVGGKKFVPEQTTKEGFVWHEMYPNPTESDVNSLEFNAVWNAIKGWDLKRQQGLGYSGATGSDVMHILEKLRKLPTVKEKFTWTDELVEEYKEWSRNRGCGYWKPMEKFKASKQSPSNTPMSKEEVNKWTNATGNEFPKSNTPKEEIDLTQPNPKYSFSPSYQPKEESLGSLAGLKEEQPSKERIEVDCMGWNKKNESGNWYSFCTKKQFDPTLYPKIQEAIEKVINK